MNGESNRIKEINQQATRWFMLLQSDDCTIADSNAHKEWLNQDIAHYRAYRELQEIWKLTADFVDSPAIIEAREEAKKSCIANSIERRGRWAPLRESNWFSLAVAASLLVVFVSLSSFNQNTNTAVKGNGIYQTSVGEQRSVSLRDGSVLALDTQTRVVVNFSRGERLIALEKGQARFEVAHDKTRPFIVAAGNGTITALGTAFIVRKGEMAVTVSLIEGSVAVVQGVPIANTPIDNQGLDLLMAEPGSEIKLEAGEQVAYSVIGISDPEPANIDQLTAWQEGRLIFDDEALTTVIEELNRYSRTKILFGDTRLKDVRVTGVFKTGDQRKAIHALQVYFDIKVSAGVDGELRIFSDTIL